MGTIAGLSATFFGPIDWYMGHNGVSYNGLIKVHNNTGYIIFLK
jgi:hypothetical protein